MSPLTSSFTPPVVAIAAAGSIDRVWEHLNKESTEIKERLKPDEELIANVVLFGGQEILVSKFGYAGPNMLIVHGQLNGKEVTAYVHQSCLQVVFSIVPKDAKFSRQPFGFESGENPQS